MPEIEESAHLSLTKLAQASLTMRIAIVEDHLMFREVVKRVCSEKTDHSVVAETGGGVAGVELCRDLRPDLLILDLGLPDMDGFAVAKAVRAVHPTLRLLILSCQLDDFTVLKIEKLGVQGFLDKATNAVEAISAALEAIAAGGTYFSAEYLRIQQARKRDSGSFDKILSDAEQDVLGLVGRGLSDEEIGRRMGIAPTTAQTHRSHLLRKLGIKSTPKLIVYAQQKGFAHIASRPPFAA